MITRIAIDGFKSFADFELDAPPFLVLVGANAGGKSNLVDALKFIAQARMDRPELVVRDFERGNGSALFRRRGTGHQPGFDIAVDELLRAETPTATWAERVESRFRAQQDQRGQITAHLDESVVARWNVGDESETVTRDLPRSWLFLATVPERAVERSSGSDLGPLAADAGNLSAVLGRLVTTQPEAFEELLLDARRLIPALDDVVPVGDHRGDWDYDLVFRETGPLAPVLASSGTLRVLALLAALHDVDHPRVVIVDELETGLHPSRLQTLVSILRERVAASVGPEGMHERQVIATTHSPVVLSQALSEHDSPTVHLLSPAYLTEKVDGVLVNSAVSRVRPVARGAAGDRGVPRAEVQRYLDTVRQEDW